MARKAKTNGSASGEAISVSAGVTEVLPPESQTRERFSALPPAMRERMFKPGQSGNPGGKSKLELEVRLMARQASPEAMARLIEVCLTTDDEKVLVVAADKIMERAFGKAKEMPPEDGDGAGSAQVANLSANERQRLKALLLKALGKKEE